MKTVLFFAIIAGIITGSSVGFTAAQCPAGSKAIKMCQSTPKKGDHIIASDTFKSIAICVDGDVTSMAFEGADGASESEVAKVDQLAGGVIYSVTAKDTTFALSLGTGIRSPAKTARFSVQFSSESDISISSTFTCK
jgi:hypothetical protein